MQVVLVFCFVFGLAFARFNTVMFRRGLSTDESKGCADLGFLDAEKALSDIQCCALCRQISGCQSVVYDANSMECSICSEAHGYAEVTERNATSISYYFLDNAEQKENEANRTMRNPIPIDCNHGPWLSKIIDANWRHFQCNFYMFVPSPMRLSDAAENAGMDSNHYWNLDDSSDGEVEHVRQTHVARDAKENRETESTLFQCSVCGKRYRWKQGLNQHISAQHSKKRHWCTKCQKTFKYQANKIQHEKMCLGGTQHICSVCGRRCSTAHGLRRHYQIHEKTSLKKAEKQISKRKSKRRDVTNITPSLPKYRCRRCTQTFSDRRELYLHGVQEHYNQTGGALQARPWMHDEDAPWGADDALRRVYQANAPLILQSHRDGPIQSVFNFPITNAVDVNHIMGFAEDIYNRLQRAFRLNLDFGVILQNRESGNYRYFIPFSNSGVFE